MNPFTAQYFVEKYQMQIHPEGGYYRETYRSPEMISYHNLPLRYSESRSFSTSIYFLMESHHFSAFHRIQSDEMWHFYYGCPVHVYVIDEKGNLEILKVGQNPESGELFQALVPAGCWFASHPAEPESFSLVGCTVAPGFDFADFEIANTDELVSQFPEHEAVIRKFSKQQI
ncbi:MAG: cupin domain-containing protein [Verrucomicrobia bacterium]|nr:cupin domain-containing protein [Cytophagales bacterium]